MIPMRMMQVTVNEIVDMIAVGHSRMTATRSVNVTSLVTAACMIRRAVIGIVGAHIQRMLIDVVAVRMVQVPVMKVVDMVAVLDCGMSAIRAMNVGVIGMWFAV